MIPTPHIEVKDKHLIAKTVLMPGDPLRAEAIANKYLTEVKKVNGVRNMLAFTGKFGKKLVTVMGSGMGMPSIGIYSYELYKFYDVQTIIRVGSCGAYTSDLKLYDVVLLEGAGGLMVPVSRELLMIDYVAEQKYPVVLVTSGRLGSLNHTLLSLEALKNRNMELHSIIYNQYPSSDELIEADSLRFITEHCRKYFPNAKVELLPERP